MSFTIEVKKREREERFGFEDLEMFHQECLGGEIELSLVTARICTIVNDSEPILNFHQLTCTRCNRKAWVIEQSEAPTEIIKTAIDGQKREIEGYQGELLEDNVGKNVITGISDDKRYDVEVNITVIQKS